MSDLLTLMQGNPAWRETFMQRINKRNAVQSDAFCGIMEAYTDLLKEKRPPTDDFHIVTDSTYAATRQSVSGSASFTQAGQLEHRLAEIQSELSETRKQKADALEQLVKLKDDVRRLELESKRKENELSAKRAEIGDREHEISVLENGLRETQTSNKTLREEVAALRADLDNTKKLLQQSEKNYEAAVSQLIRLQQSEAERMNEMHEFYQQKIAALMKPKTDGTEKMPSLAGMQVGHLDRRASGLDEQNRVLPPSRKKSALKPHDGVINSVCARVCPHQTPHALVVTGGQDAQLCLIDGKERTTIRGWVATPTRGAISSVALPEDTTCALVGAADNALYLVDFSTERCVQTLKGHMTGRIVGCEFLSASKPYKAISASSDRTLRLWDINRSACVKTASHPSAMTCVALSPDREWVATGHQSGAVVLWNVRSENCQQVGAPDPKPHSDSVTGLSFSPDGTCIVSQGRDNTVKLTDVRRADVVCEFTHTDLKTGCPTARPAFSPDGNLIVCSTLTHLLCWNLYSKKLLTNPVCGNLITTLNWDLNNLITCHRDGTVTFWE
eukprot:GDKI01040572.1.p1 GENE.GDKI01040572.1~~GDKI01040572.1.p1  ORF type:complete len:558 (-),score=111.52 GDKI01040572.1:22-1695(-)